MPRNLSVEQLQQLLSRIPPAVATELKLVPREQAELLAGVMRRAVHTGQDGVHELRDSIRVEDGRTPLRVLVKAGGPMTTRQDRSSGAFYDYALANEFGTYKMTPRPFFWPSYRLMKKQIRAAMQRRAKAAIAKVVPVK